MAWLGKGEIHQPIIDQINQQIAEIKPAVAKSQRLRIADQRIHAVPRKHLLGQHKLRIQILILRRIIDNGNPAQRGRATLALPFGAKHCDHRRLEACSKAGFRNRHPSGATQGLRQCQQRVQKCPPALVFTSISFGASSDK